MAFQSIVARKSLGTALKSARQAAGLSTSKGGEIINRDQSTYSRIELGKAPLTMQGLVKLAHAYGIDGGELVRLQDLLLDSRSGNRWQDAYNSFLTPQYAELIAMENEANRLTAIQLQVVPGLLQTSRYAAALFDSLPMDPDRIEGLIEVRMHRQRRFEDAEPLAMTAILTEAVLWYQYSDDDVHLEQLRHLRRMCDHPQVTIRIIPCKSMVDVSSMDLYEFAREDTPTAYSETFMNTIAVVERDLNIRQVRRMLSLAQKAALPPEGSALMIEQRMDGMR